MPLFTNCSYWALILYKGKSNIAECYTESRFFTPFPPAAYLNNLISKQISYGKSKNLSDLLPIFFTLYMDGCKLNLIRETDNLEEGSHEQFQQLQKCDEPSAQHCQLEEIVWKGKIEKEMEAFLNIKLSYFSLLEDEKRRGFPRTSTGRRSCANLQTLVREILQWVSTEYNTGLEWFPFSLSTTAFDWFRKLASPSQPKHFKNQSLLSG